jgi:carboxyl-terminal processing protease
MSEYRTPVRSAVAMSLLLVCCLSPCFSQPPPSHLTATERVVGLTTLYFEAKYNFANWDNVPNLDWDKSFHDYLAQVEKDQTEYDYYLTLMRFYGLLHDGHTFVWPPASVLQQLDSPPMVILPIQGKAIIASFAATAEILNARITKGCEIIQIDGRPVKEVLENDILPIGRASTAQARDLEGYRRILLGKTGTMVRVRIRDMKGEEHEVTLTRNKSGIPREKRPHEWDAPPLLEYRQIGDGIHYIALNSFNDHTIISQFDSVTRNLAHMKGLILDVRQNGGGNDGIGFEIISRMISKTIHGSQLHSIQYVPFYRAKGDSIGEHWESLNKGDISPLSDSTITCPIVVLVGPATGSAAEDFLNPLVHSKRVTLIGEPTAGSTGLRYQFPLPGGGSGYVCTVTDYYPGGPKWIGVGFIPDIEVRRSVRDLVEGNDPVLQKGIDYLRGHGND